MIRNTSAFQKRVKTALGAKNMTLTELSQKSEVPVSTLSRMLAGNSNNIHDRSYFRILKVLDLEPNPEDTAPSSAQVSPNLVGLLTSAVKKLDDRGKADLMDTLQRHGGYTWENAMALWLATNWSDEFMEPLVEIFDHVTGDDEMMKHVMAFALEKLTKESKAYTSYKAGILTSYENS